MDLHGAIIDYFVNWYGESEHPFESLKDWFEKNSDVWTMPEGHTPETLARAITTKFDAMPTSVRMFLMYGNVGDLPPLAGDDQIDKRAWNAFVTDISWRLAGKVLSDWLRDDFGIVSTEGK